MFRQKRNRLLRLKRVDFDKTEAAQARLSVSSIFGNNYNVIRKFGNHINTVVNQGGTSSGKTFALMQLMFVLAINGEKMRENLLATKGGKRYGNALNIRVVAKHFTSLRNDAMEIAEKIHAELVGMGFNIKYNKSTHVYQFKNGSKIKFVGLDNPEKAKFGKYDYTYICEATSLRYEVYKALHVRTFQITFIDYNPSFEFWVHTRVMLNPDKTPNPCAVAFRSTYANNPYLDQSTIENIESNKQDVKWWRVYGMGFTGQLEGLVFNNWEPCKEFPKEAQGLTLGLDFGSNAPSALILAGFYNGAIYLKEFLYGKSIDNIGLVRGILLAYDFLQQGGYSTETKDGLVRVMADAEDRRAINELRLLGNGNILINAARKGGGSVMNGLNYMMAHKIYIEATSENLIREFYNLQWAKNKDQEEKNVTIGSNHAIDAARYALEGKMIRNLSLIADRRKALLDRLDK